jgi:hypothetical protein
MLRKKRVPTLQSLTGNYRFFTGKFGYREILTTCFGSVQGLKGQISMKYREIYVFCAGISILHLHLIMIMIKFIFVEMDTFLVTNN